MHGQKNIKLTDTCFEYWLVEISRDFTLSGHANTGVVP